MREIHYNSSKNIYEVMVHMCSFSNYGYFFDYDFFRVKIMLQEHNGELGQMLVSNNLFDLIDKEFGIDKLQAF